MYLLRSRQLFMTSSPASCIVKSCFSIACMHAYGRKDGHAYLRHDGIKERWKSEMHGRKKAVKRNNRSLASVHDGIFFTVTFFSFVHKS